MTGIAGLRIDIVILACAISAGIHAGLAPDHFAEGTATGIGFVGSAVVLAIVAVALTVRPASAVALAGAAVTFVGLIAAYVLATTTGVPVFQPGAEPVEGLALATKAVEAIGLVASAGQFAIALRPDAGTRSIPRPVPLALTALVSIFSLLAALAFANGHGGDGHTHQHTLSRETQA